MGNRKTIALLIGALSDRYQTYIWPSICAACKENDTNLIIIAGGIPKNNNPSETESINIYDLINKKTIDGLLIIDCIGAFLEKKEFEEFFDKYQGFPIISLGTSVGNYPYIEVNNEHGMFSMVDHLIRIHGKKEIAIISGPKNNAVAQARLTGYRQALEENGITFNSEFIYYGNFQEKSGREAVKHLLNRKDLNIDGIVSANDEMLLGALDEMKKMGKSIPSDIAIGGFDDIDDTRFTNPTLTSIAQPLDTMGSLGVKLLIDEINGVKIKKSHRLKTRFINRKSCGCIFNDERNDYIDLYPIVEKEDILEMKISVSCNSFINKVVEKLSLNFDLMSDFTENILEILNVFVSSYQENKLYKFSEYFLNFVESDNSYGDNYKIWHNTAEEIKKYLTVIFDSEKMELMKIYDQFQKIFSRFTDLISQENSWRRHSSQTSYLRHLSKMISTTSKYSEMFNLLEEHLGYLGINECYISLYEDFILNNSTLPEFTNLEFAYYKGRRIDNELNDKKYRTDNILPDYFMELDHEISLVVFPLSYKEEQYGFLVLKVTTVPRVTLYYDFLRDQISSAIKSINNQMRLAAAQKKLVHSANMSSLGELTAGIAHEIKNPLNFIINFSETVLDFIEEYNDCETDDEKDELIVEIKEATQSIFNQSKKADKIVKGMLNQAKGDSGYVENFNINNLLRESSNLVFHSYRSQYPDIKITYTEDYDDNIPTLEGNISQLNRALVNIIANAFYAVQQKGKTGDNDNLLVEISSLMDKNTVRIIIKDYGVGIPDSIKNSIFKPFFTTKPNNEGTGLGLKLARDIIVDGFGGEIYFKSSLGEYTEFIIEINN